MKLSTKIMLVNAIIVAVAITVTTAIAISTLRSTLLERAGISQATRMKTLKDLLARKGSDFKAVDGKLMAGNYVVNNNFEIPDKMQEICGGTATIFLGDTRISTNVMKDGVRAVGTKLQGPAYDAIFKENKGYEGETAILGTPYFTRYEPIKNGQGETIGALYVGVKKGEFFAEYVKLKWILSTLSLVLIALSAMVVGVAVKMSLKRLGTVIGVLDEAAAGNLSARVSGGGQDEIGHLGNVVNKMLADMNEALLKVVDSSNMVATAAAQLNGMAEQMAIQAEEVASQTGSMAAASEEMAATSTEIARNCSMAADGSSISSDSAKTGAGVVSETVQLMSSIAAKVKDSARTVESLGEKSDQIGAIIGTIEDIADQTNLLALNAAIEAARAGEMGRGFAVVADEVRALAERTTKATREIGVMINAIQHETKGAVAAMEEGVLEVEKGTEASMKSGQALDDILQHVNDVAAQINQIATAAEEQTATTTEITSNIQKVTEVVHETTRGAQESASGASELARLAEELKGMTAAFRLASP
ncbi:methyl-accepting chemotaxis protein [Geomonas sp. Red276]